jgi:hypothetical protein
MTTTTDDAERDRESNQADLTSFGTGNPHSAFTPVSDIEALTGVGDLRNGLEWYRNAHSHGSDGPPLPISGVWEVICGKPHQSITPGREQIETVGEMESQLAANREAFVENNEEFTPEHIDRIIALLRGLDAVESEYRVYGEDREPTSQLDLPVRCFVGIYHVTDRTTLLTYQHQSPGMGHTVATLNGVETPRMDIEDKLRSDVFNSKYDYVR